MTMLDRQIKDTANRIYKAHLPPYMRVSWGKGQGQWYEDRLKEELDILLISEADDEERLNELKRIEPQIALLFAIFGSAFRLLALIGMHIRAQTLGQYEYMPEEEKLLRRLCRKWLQEEGFGSIAGDYMESIFGGYETDDEPKLKKRSHA